MCGPVFALLLGEDGHALQRRFVAVEQDDAEESIALEGAIGAIPVQDSMDRIAD